MNLSQYDVIVLGYPCWWFTAPMTIPSFLEGKDLAGKLIVPYMCSYSSPFEVTLPALVATAPGVLLFTGLTLDKDRITASSIPGWIRPDCYKTGGSRMGHDISWRIF